MGVSICISYIMIFTFATFVYFSLVYFTAQKMKFSIKDFFSKCDQIRSFLQIWSYLLKNSLMKKFIFCEVLFVLVPFFIQILLIGTLFIPILFIHILFIPVLFISQVRILLHFIHAISKRVE